MTTATLTMEKHALPRLGWLLTAAGVLILAWGGWNLLLPARGELHSYTLDKQGSAAEFPALELPAESGLTISRYTISAEGADRAVANAYVAQSATGGPVLLQWENQLAEPLLYQQGTLPELVKVAQAIREHASRDSLILGWWDELRRLQLLGVETGEVPGHLREPLLLPAVWERESQSIVPVEEQFWGESRSAGDTANYRAYIEILSGSEAQAVERLRALAAGRDVILAVNIADLIKLGAQSADRFGIGYRDFADTGNLHGMIERVKTWLNEQGHSHYLVQKTSDSTMRLYYLTDEASSGSLISSLLPFSGGGLVDLTQLKLVYQVGSYWVFQLSGEDGAGARPAVQGDQ